METENKDWKPEVGKTAWLKRYPYTIEQVMIIADGSTKLHYRQNYSIGEGEFVEHTSAQDRDYFFESPEAALASIKIYDLEGKEVVIPRAEPDFLLQELESSGRILSLLEKEFFEFCKQDPENVAKFGLALMGGGAAIGGKSKPKEKGDVKHEH